jgi:hypothetical protein
MKVICVTIVALILLGIYRDSNVPKKQNIPAASLEKSFGKDVFRHVNPGMKVDDVLWMFTVEGHRYLHYGASTIHAESCSCKNIK